MPKGIMLVRSAPSAPEREDEYNDWYDRVHLPEVLAIPGIVGATRFKLSEVAGVEPDGGPAYLAIYELDADDLGAPLAGLRDRAGSGEVQMSDVLGMDPPPSIAIYERLEG